MMSLNITTIPLCINGTKSIWLPDFSEILDISLDEFNQVKILYQYDYQLAGMNPPIVIKNCLTCG